MIIIISCMLTGFIAGFLLRNKRISLPGRAITPLVWVLLFMLGVTIGSDKQLMASLSHLGLQAVAIGFLSTLGSCVGAWLLWKFIKRKAS